MEGVVEKWKDKYGIFRASFLELIAGKNRAQGVSALLNNWYEVIAVLRTSLNASGFIEKENTNLAINLVRKECHSRDNECDHLISQSGFAPMGAPSRAS